MKSKNKFIIALVLFGVVTIGAIAGIIAVVASFNANVESNFKVSYTAQNVHATVSAGYVVSTTNSTTPQSLKYTAIKSGSAEQIEFNAGDEAEEVEKSFDGLNLDIKKNEYVYFKYTFTHTGDETNSMKFLNIALTKDFTQFENLTMEYASASNKYTSTIFRPNYTSWNPEINELTAVRGEDNITDVYIRLYVTTKTKDAKLDGMLNWNLTGSEEYAYENAYITGDYLSEGLKSNNASSVTEITFDYLNEETENFITSATTTIPVYSDGSYGVNAYVVGTKVYVLSEYNIKASSFYRVLYGLSNLTKVTFNNIDTSNVANMDQAFASDSALTSIDLTPLDTSNVTNMGSMFYGCTGLTSIDITPLDTSNVTDMGSMFYGCTGLTSIDLSVIDTSKVTNMYYMFKGCTGLTELNLTGLNMGSLTSVEDIFQECTNLSNINLSNAKMGTTMDSMFYGCTGLTSIDLSGLDTSKVTNMHAIFYKCAGLTSIDLSGLDTSKVTDMGAMFSECTNLTNIDLTGLDTSKVTDMNNMFRKCAGLTSIDLSPLDTRNVTDMRGMFYECTNLVTIYADESFNTSKVTGMLEGVNMFYDCTSLVGGNGTVFNGSYTDKTYARIDKAGTPGYFTLKEAG